VKGKFPLKKGAKGTEPLILKKKKIFLEGKSMAVIPKRTEGG